MYALWGCDLATHDSASRDGTTGQRRQRALKKVFEPSHKQEEFTPSFVCMVTATMVKNPPRLKILLSSSLNNSSKILLISKKAFVLLRLQFFTLYTLIYISFYDKINGRNFTDLFLLLLGGSTA
jgi:hypothetical protein